MYNIVGIESNVQNIYKACHAFIGEEEIEDIRDLRLPFFKFLQKHQPESPVNFSDSIFIYDNDIEEQLKDAYSIGSLDDLKQSTLIGEPYTLEEKIEKIERVTKALQIFKELDEDFFALFTSVIHSIFIRKHAHLEGSSGTHGGSSSGAIGVIWLTVNDTINEFDLVELLIHEFTHNLIFIDELNKQQFVYSEIRKKENYAYSSILNLNRPLDKVIHSIVVATELLISRDKFLNFEYKKNVHPESAVMADNIFKAVESVKNLENLNKILYPRGIELMENCVKSLSVVS